MFKYSELAHAHVYFRVTLGMSSCDLTKIQTASWQVSVRYEYFFNVYQTDTYNTYDSLYIYLHVAYTLGMRTPLSPRLPHIAHSGCLNFCCLAARTCRSCTVERDALQAGAGRYPEEWQAWLCRSCCCSAQTYTSAVGDASSHSQDRLRWGAGGV